MSRFAQFSSIFWTVFISPLFHQPRLDCSTTATYFQEPESKHTPRWYQSPTTPWNSSTEVCSNQNTHSNSKKIISLFELATINSRYIFFSLLCFYSLTITTYQKSTDEILSLSQIAIAFRRYISFQEQTQSFKTFLSHSTSPPQHMWSAVIAPTRAPVIVVVMHQELVKN